MAAPMSADGALVQDGLEVATLSADTLRASIRVTGPVLPATSPLLIGILRTHVSAGRRYLRIDLTGAAIEHPDVVATLVEAHRSITDLGGMLVLENAGPRVAAVRGAGLHVLPSA